MRELGEGMRRIYELMRSNDLGPPQLLSENNAFSITLHHSFIYTQEERLWLDQFSALDLSREQKTLVRLGYGGRLVSPREIWDAVGIVDTDYYRKLIESLTRLRVLKRTVRRDDVVRVSKTARGTKRALVSTSSSRRHRSCRRS